VFAVVVEEFDADGGVGVLGAGGGGQGGVGDDPGVGRPSVVGFDVLPGDQRQQSDRVGRFRVEFALGKVPEDAVRVADEGIDQVGAGVGVVPGDVGFPGLGVVMGGGVFGDHRAGAGNLAGDPADRGDQLGHRVLGGDRVLEHGRVRARRVLPVSTPVSATTALTASKIRFGAVERARRRRQ
jgi:hypothetical protein